MQQRQPAVAFLLASLLCSCTNIIDTGEYGPFRIGEPKQDALLKVLAVGSIVEPLPSPDIYIENPSRDELDQLSRHSGVLVWVDDEPSPLRVEFSGDALSETWPEFASHTYRGPNPETYSRLEALQSALPPGTPRRSAFDAIDSASRNSEVSVGVFVVGYQPFRTGEKSDAAEFERLLMATDAWRFDGLREELWFDPFYSRVTLHFEKDTLNQIEHWWFLFETP